MRQQSDLAKGRPGQATSFLLFRYLVSSFLAKKTRSQATIGVLLPVFGVAIGVAAFTIVLSIMSGFVINLKNRLLSLESHIEIVAADRFGNVQADSEFIHGFVKNPLFGKKIDGASAFIKGDAIVQARGRASTVVLTGVDPAEVSLSGDYHRFQTVEATMKVLANNARSLQDDGAEFPGLMLGKDLASLLGVNIGDRITLVSTTPEEGPGGLAPLQFPVVLVDILDTGSPTHDAKMALVSLSSAQTFFGLEDAWSGVQVRLKEPLDAEVLVHKMDETLKSSGLRAKPWTEANKTLLRALKLERWGMTFVLYMVILVGCFSITITLVLAVKRKTREMAILRAMGFEKKDLGRLFLLHGLSIGLLGVSFGLLIGFAALGALGSEKFAILNTLYAGKNIPVKVDWTAVLSVSFGSLFLAMLAAIWPAVEVMRIDVVQSLSDRQ